MKRILKVLGVFFIVAMQAFALTAREKIDRDLRKLNVAEDLIVQTIELEEEMADKTFVGPFAEAYVNQVRELADRDLRNYHLISHLVRYYLEASTVKDARENKKYIDVYLENVPQEWEQLAVKISYNQKIGNIEESRKYYQEFTKKYGDKGIGKFFLTNFKTDLSEIKSDLAEALKLFKKEIAAGNKDDITDEEMFLFQNTYDIVALEELFQKNQYQKAIDYYLKNMANQSNYSQGVMNIFGDRLTSQLFMIANINQEFLNNNEDNIREIKNSKVFYELERTGKIVKTDTNN